MQQRSLIKSKSIYMRYLWSSESGVPGDIDTQKIIDCKAFVSLKEYVEIQEKVVRR